MTAPVPLARLAEGWCPHPDHGRLQATARGSRCVACDGTWRLWPWPGEGGALVFRVTVGDQTYSAIFDPRYPRDPVGAIEDHTAEAHRQAAAGPPRQDPTP